jgi:hypothetical protein
MTDYSLYFGPDSIWVHELKRPAGWWVIRKNETTHTTFIGPFSREEHASAYMREEYTVPELVGPGGWQKIKRYRDENLALAAPSIKPIQDLSATALNIEMRPISNLVAVFAGDELSRDSVKEFLADCLGSILTQHPRSDLRIVLNEAIVELRQ